MAIEIVVAVPTFRRRELLTNLLRSLEGERSPGRVALLIGDNDCDPDIANLVEGFDRPDSPCRYVGVTTRGLSSIRNALVAEAIQMAPGLSYLVMLDDDGLVTPGWLARLVECARENNADLVGGPVEGLLPPGAGTLARNSVYASRKRSPTGPVDLLNTTQNLLIARQVIDRFGTEFFRMEYNFSGGEDYDFFRRVRAVDGVIVWCDEAIVMESAHADRIGARQVLSRYYTTGLYMSKIDSHYDGRGAAWKVAGRGLAGAVAKTTIALVAGDGSKRARGLLSISYFTGRLLGMCGQGSSRYR